MLLASEDIKQKQNERTNERTYSGLQSPGEIKRMEVSWTLTRKLDCHLRVQAKSRGGRWCWTLKRAQ